MTTFKNKLLKLIMTGMLVLAAFAFISCGGDAPEDNDDSDGGSGTGTGEILTAEQSAAELKKLDAYDIVVEVSTGGYGFGDDEPITMEMAKKGKTYWTIAYGYGSAYKFNGDSYDMYMGQQTESGAIEWMYIKSEPASTIEDSLEQMNTAFDGSLFYAGDLVENFVEAGSAKLAGRNCTKYVWSDSASAGGQSASAQETIYIDNQTGICMKLEASGTKNGTVTDSVSFEVKKFLTGNSVVAPNLPAATAMY